MSNSRIGLRAALIGGAALTLLAWASQSVAATASAEDQEVRIARLEAAVAALQAQAQDQATLKRQNAELQAQDAELKQDVVDLEAQVQDLKVSTATQIQDVRSTTSATVATIANGKPTIATSGGAFSATLHGVMQFDAGQSFVRSSGPVATDFRRTGPALGATTTNTDAAHARDLNSSTNFRRARIGIDGKVFSSFDYSLLYEASRTERCGAQSRRRRLQNRGATLRQWRSLVRVRRGDGKSGLDAEHDGDRDRATVRRAVGRGLSNGVQSGPPIGVQKGPPWR